MAWAGQITGWREADVAAIDFDNGPWVFGSVDAFYAACREVGLVPGVFDWESWHVIDLTRGRRSRPTTRASPSPRRKNS